MSFSFEKIFPNGARKETSETITEENAEKELEEILARPENAFLEMPINKDVIEDANSSVEALAFVKGRIRERLERTMNVREVVGSHVEPIKVNPDAVINAIEHISAHMEQIGEGADGRVVIDVTDTENTNPNICYKMSLLEKVKRGRNSCAEEVELQGAFYEFAHSLDNQDIAVPAPFYEVEVNTTEMIAMERLHAKSADDILRSFGSLPEWFDIDRFCESLKSFLDAAHTNGLYHRDLHFGNIMLSQACEWKEGEPMGYVIDFGLSGYAQENMEPYKKEVAGYTFTYDDDYGRIESLRKSLKEMRERRA